MNVEATRRALEDAGVAKDAVDAVLVKYPTSEYRSMYGQTVAEALGLQPRIGGVWDQGGATNISMISFAAMAIEHGQCEVAVVTTADNPRTGTPRRRTSGPGATTRATAGSARLARLRHDRRDATWSEYGTTARAARRGGGRRAPPRGGQPHAQLRKPLTLDEYCGVAGPSSTRSAATTLPASRTAAPRWS